MKKNMKAFFSQLYPLPEETPTSKREEGFRISRGNHNNKNHSQQVTRSYEHKRGELSSMAKYQSYLQFINQGKIQVQNQSNNQPYFTGRKINQLTSKTPILETSLIYQNQIQRRRSMLERRRISPYLDKSDKSPQSFIRKQKQKVKSKKLSSSYRKRTNNNSQERSSMEKKGESEQQLQKTLFDGIQFFRDLGKGAHAVVRSAIDWKSRRKIAVKVYKKDDLNQQELDSIKSQILILRSIRHPHIASLYNVIETPKTINLIMEYGGGNSLFQHIRSKPTGFFSEVEAKPLFKQILEALSYLHERNIVHRDIKPQNILINKANQVKIIDFGFSLISGLQQKIDSYCGTITYMAPQIVNKKPHVGIYADRWSLGVLLYTILQGAFPFRASNQAQLFAKITKGSFEYVVDISRQASILIESFMTIKPTARASAKQALQSEWLKSKTKV